MSLAYTRAYVDRASTESDGPIRFIAATAGRKGDNIDLRMNGAQLDRYRSNPVFLYGHRYFSRDDLPIGRGSNVTVEGDRLLIDVTFDQDDEFARKVERKYRGGWMNAVSIGFDVMQWEGGKGSYWGGGVAERWELLELSAVPVPMDSSAVVESGRARLLADLGVDGVDVPVDVLREVDGNLLQVRVSEQLVDQADTLRLGVAIARGLINRPRSQPVAPAPEVPDRAPAPAGVPSDAAQGLLAAFTL